MRHLGVLLLTAAACLTASAHAAAIDTFTVTPAAGGTAITFQLPASPTEITVDPDGVDFQFYGVATSVGLTNVLFFGESDFGGFELETLQHLPIVNDYGPQMYTGTAEAPTFLLGTFSLTNPYTGMAADIVTVSPPAIAVVTPEPSSLILLGTGVVGVISVVRCRFTL